MKCLVARARVGLGVLALLATASGSWAAAPTGQPSVPSIASVAIQPQVVPANSTAGIIRSCTWLNPSYPTCVSSPGPSATGTVTLSGPAPSGGARVTLSSTGYEVGCPRKKCGFGGFCESDCVVQGAWVPWAVFIPAGSMQADFSVYAPRFVKYTFSGCPPPVPGFQNCVLVPPPPVPKPPLSPGQVYATFEEGYWEISVQAAFGGSARSGEVRVRPGLDQAPAACSGGSPVQFLGPIENGQYAPLPAGRINQAYSTRLFQGGRDAQVVLSGGPGGLALDKGGVLSGTPTVPGDFKLNIQVAELCGGMPPRFATATLKVADTPPQIASATLTPTTLPAPGGEVALSVRASANAGIARVLLTQVQPSGQQNSGIVPLVSGTPTNGDWRVSWRIAANGGSAPQTYTIKVLVHDTAGQGVEAPPMQLTVAGSTGGSTGAAQGSPGQAVAAPGAQPRPQGPVPAAQGQKPGPAPQTQAGPATQMQALPPAGSAAQGQAAPGAQASANWWVKPLTAQDAALAQALQTRLQQQGGSPWGRVAGSVGVEVAGGAVRLTGTLTSAQHRAAIENLVRGTQGVRGVTNAITIGP